MRLSGYQVIRLSGFAFIILALFFGFSYAEEKAPFVGKINSSDINLRSDATTLSAVISVLAKGTQVEVVSESYDWYKIRLPKNTPVYISKALASCVSFGEEQSPLSSGPSIRQCSSAKVLKDRVNIRVKPSEKAAIAGIADKNEIVNVVSETGAWYKIEPIQNSFGWVYKKFVDKSSLPVKPEAVKPSQEKISSQELQDNNVMLTGIVKPYGMVFMRPATHKLITAEGKVFLLKGNRTSLNALNHQKVKIIGKIISAPSSKYPVLEVRIIELVN